MGTIFAHPTQADWSGQSSRDAIVVEGAEELRTKLMALSKGIDVDLAEEALLEAAMPMRERAAALAPRAAGAGHGKGGVHLADNIRVEAAPQEPGAANLNLGMEKHTWYGRFFEFGTRRIAARPFLRPAYDAEKDGTVKRWGEILRTKIAEFAGSAEG